MSPTKRLQEMGITVVEDEDEDDGLNGVFVKSKRSPLQMYANVNENEAEEHILPDSFDEVNEAPKAGDKAASISPASRKSASSQASKGSQDSGIGISGKKAGQNGGVKVNKAWYDVPSEDETEAPEADSLASIISHRGSSEDEEGN